MVSFLRIDSDARWFIAKPTCYQTMGIRLGPTTLKSKTLAIMREFVVGGIGLKRRGKLNTPIRNPGVWVLGRNNDLRKTKLPYRNGSLF